MDPCRLVVDDNLKTNSHACIEVVNKSNLIENWDWYGQTACLAAAAAQDPAQEGRSRDHRKCRNLTRKSIKHEQEPQQQKNQQRQTIFMKFTPIAVNSFIKP